MSRKIRTASAWLSIALFCAVATGCPGAELHGQMVTLRRLHANYRAAVIPRPDLDADKVNQLGTNLDATMANLEELTR